MTCNLRVTRYPPTYRRHPWFPSRSNARGALSLSWEQHGTVRGRVVDVEAPRRFSYRWAVLRESFDSEPAEGNSTLVEFTLEAEGDGTRLRVVESGFDKLFADPAKQDERAEDNRKGWGIELGELADYAERVAV